MKKAVPNTLILIWPNPLMHDFIRVKRYTGRKQTVTYGCVLALKVCTCAKTQSTYGGTIDRAGAAGSNSQGVNTSRSKTDPAVISGD